MPPRYSAGMPTACVKKYSTASSRFPCAASVLDQCLQVFNLAFLGEGLFVGARATAAPVVVVDREVLAKQFGQLRQTRVKGTIRHRTVDQDDGWAGPNLAESNCRAVLRSDCWHGILLFLPVSMFRLKNCRTFTLFTSW